MMLRTTSSDATAAKAIKALAKSAKSVCHLKSVRGVSKNVLNHDVDADEDSNKYG